MNKNRDTMAWENYERMMHEALVNPNFHSIVLDLQNEPTLDRDLLQRIKFIRQNQKHPVFIGLTSNGLQFDAEFATKLFNAGLNKAVFSLNALDAETYDKVSPKVDFSKVQKNLDSLLGDAHLRDKIVVSFGVDRNNASQAADFRNLMSQSGGKYRIFPFGTRIDQVNNKQIEDIDHLFKSCHYPLYAMPILLNGDAILCCHDWKRSKVFGNVLENSIAEVWNGASYKAARDEVIYNGRLPHAICQKCDSPYEYGGHLSMNDRTSREIGISFFPRADAEITVSPNKRQANVDRHGERFYVVAGNRFRRIEIPKWLAEVFDTQILKKGLFSDSSISLDSEPLQELGAEFYRYAKRVEGIVNRVISRDKRLSLWQLEVSYNDRSFITQRIRNFDLAPPGILIDSRVPFEMEQRELSFVLRLPGSIVAISGIAKLQQKSGKNIMVPRSGTLPRLFPSGSDGNNLEGVELG